MTERLQKILSGRGVASRRAAEKMITEGRITINGRVAALGERLLKTGAEELLICLEGDMAKALGQYLTLHGLKHCLCIDGIQPTPESYLDIGMPIGSAYPVVVKTLILENGGNLCN